MPHESAACACALRVVSTAHDARHTSHIAICTRHVSQQLNQLYTSFHTASSPRTIDYDRIQRSDRTIQHKLLQFLFPRCFLAQFSLAPSVVFLFVSLEFICYLFKPAVSERPPGTTAPNRAPPMVTPNAQESPGHYMYSEERLRVAALSPRSLTRLTSRNPLPCSAMR